MASQYIQLVPRVIDGFGSGPSVELDLDPDFSDSIADAYLYFKFLVYSDIQNDLVANSGSIVNLFAKTDGFAMGIHAHGGQFDWYAGFGSGADFAPVTFGDYVVVEIHARAGHSTFNIRIDGTLYSGITGFGLPSTGVNYMGMNSFPPSWVGTGGGTEANDSIAISQMAYAFDDWISQGGEAYARWSFNAADPIGDAIANYPDPPFFAYVGTDPTSIEVFEGGGDDDPDVLPGEGGPGPGVNALVRVSIDDVDITDCVQTGSVTRKLNRPWEATLRMFTDCAPGDACSHVKIYVDEALWFHGFVLQISTEAGEDGNLMSEYTCQDPMFLWQWRPARDGPDATDPGDFSNPQFFKEIYGGPPIMEQILLQSIDDSDPEKGEGTLFIDVAGGDFPLGTYDLSGAPTDWPMTIAEVFELMSSTGTLDVVLTPVETDDPMCTIAAYNGDYGTDHSDGPDGDSTVIFEYETGAHNVRALTMVEDSSNVCNKLWYYLGPRVQTPTDPGSVQHWRANITGQDLGLSYPPGGVAVGALNDPVGPPWTDDQIGERVYNSRISGCGVRMEVQIFDAQGDENPSEGRELYRRQWQMEQWIRAIPRTLVHVTPVRTSGNDLLPPGVTPIALGSFDIGDLVTVTAGPTVRGGFTGVQRVYAYTVSWDEDGVVEIGEIQTTSDQEGIIGA